MAASRGDAASTVRSFLSKMKKSPANVDLDTSLYEEGAGLDSLEVAELSAFLEDELGRDPFSEGFTPETVGEIVAFYDAPES